ncbi:hypothetical protein ABL78_2329 [Leptomonas seymouri]|uniref:Short-chain dehydrogenase n=1 Tax=Leptomonas seymouri TaxID=5684 RepID=A0A0N0P7B0_LEPSE|nr:hypothetical protein ABL78_2329 [Leptomonas seymouri]|eukprot:KPI88596.1 hypothetical protein ABL78_2329 [Leptomonas seymouri]
MILLTLICGTLWLAWWVYSLFAYRPRRLAGATVIVTGACSDVGRRFCTQLYAHGARVIAWDYSRIKLQELQAEVQRVEVTVSANGIRSSNSSYIDSHFFISSVDVSSRMQLQRAAKDIDGPIDIIVNAAHTYPTKPLHSRADDSVDRVFQANLVAPLLVVRQLLPSLLSKRGSRDDYAQIVNIVCSRGNYVVATHAPDYAASQWGLVGLHYSMRSWIAQERAMYMHCSNERKDDVSSGVPSGTSNSSTSAAMATGGGSGPGGRGMQNAREVRMTLLCLDDIQSGFPTTLSSMLAPFYTTKTPDRDEATASSGGGGNDRCVARSGSLPHDAKASMLQKRNAELDRAVACCMAAICRGQERCCYATSWTTTFIFPVVMLCPLPWAERLLRWLQRSADSVTAFQS